MTIPGTRMSQRSFSRSNAIGQSRLSSDGLMPLMPALGALALEEQAESRDIVYDLSTVDLALFEAPARTAGLEHWAHLLPPLLLDGGLGEGRTPLFRAALSVSEGSLWVKDESRNPTGTHKDRLARCIVSAVAWAGGRGVVVASTGNHALATAAYCVAADLECVAVLTEGAPQALRDALYFYGAEVIEAEWDERWRITRELVKQDGFASATNLNAAHHVGHPFGPEGYKTIAYEIVCEIGSPAVVSCPVGYGELMAGVVKGFEEMYALGVIDSLPTILGCESASRAPLARIARSPQWSHEKVPALPTVAFSIGTTSASHRAWRAAQNDWVSIVEVSEDLIIQARSDLARRGLYVETSSASALAGLREAVARHPRLGLGPAVLINTSSGFRDCVLQGN